MILPFADKETPGLTRVFMSMKNISKVIDLAKVNEAKKKNLLKEAYSLLQDAMSLVPDYEPALELRGELLMGIEEETELLAASNEFIGFNPKNPRAGYQKAAALESMGEYEEALVALDEAIELDAEFRSPQLSKGRVLQRMGQYEESLKLLTHLTEEERSKDVNAMSVVHNPSRTRGVHKSSRKETILKKSKRRALP